MQGQRSFDAAPREYFSSIEKVGISGRKEATTRYSEALTQFKAVTEDRQCSPESM